MKHVLSYGGGVNSSALFFHILETGRPLDVVIFADTGEESPETYDAVTRMERECISRGIQFVIVRSNYGRLVDYYFQHRSVPSIMRRDCTSKFKISPIRKWLRATYGLRAGIKLYVGITYDEIHRMRTSDVKWIENIYPFCDDRIDRAGNLDILRRNNFSAIKSGCQGCIYQKRSEWVRLLRVHPEVFARWEAMEKNGKRYPQITISPKISLEKIRLSEDACDGGEEVSPPCAVFGGCFL